MRRAITPAHAIVVDRLSKRFDAVTAVDDISFAVPVGSTTALLGVTAPARRPRCRSFSAC
jgi:ABC-type uncharacterized transport system ATPase subunit